MFEPDTNVFEKRSYFLINLLDLLPLFERIELW